MICVVFYSLSVIKEDDSQHNCESQNGCTLFCVNMFVFFSFLLRKCLKCFHLVTCYMWLSILFSILNLPTVKTISLKLAETPIP